MRRRPLPFLAAASRARPTHSGRCGALAAAGVAAVLAWPGGAWAHAVLVRGTPTAGAAVPAGPLHVDLQFNSRIERKASRLDLQGPDGGARKLSLEDAPPDVLRAEADLVPGAYLLRWQVLALDGHLTRGSIAFSAVAPARPATVGSTAQ